MVAQTTTPDPDPLAPDVVYERRKAIIEAIRFELELEQAVLQEMEAQLAILESDESQEAIADELSGEVTEKQFETGELEDALQGVLNTLDVHQINQIKKELDL